jgi:uncharacterized protein (DUF1778 family)
VRKALSPYKTGAGVLTVQRAAVYFHDGDIAMAMKNSTDFVRIDARIQRHIKTALEEAAHIQGLSQTDFMVAAICEAANKIIRENSVIQLCVEDQRTLASALLDESPSTKQFGKLRRAVRRSRAMAGMA